ncbi:hypothetical protein T484DRAFT_1866475 [Baffinella frigidus]|nr:hypothetical protein T484DRAFT_1866475 [Cryptophyta sp. CCMP2293]
MEMTMSAAEDSSDTPDHTNATSSTAVDASTPVRTASSEAVQAEQELLIYGSHQGARRSLLLSAEEEEEPEEEAPSTPQKVREEDPYVRVLESFTADAFFMDPVIPVKAVLFTKKPQVPGLWKQVAAAQRRNAAFGVVLSTEEDLVSRFGFSDADLPKVLVLMPGRRLTFAGTVDVHALSSFVLAAANQSWNVVMLVV